MDWKMNFYKEKMWPYFIVWNFCIFKNLGQFYKVVFFPCQNSFFIPYRPKSHIFSFTCKCRKLFWAITQPHTKFLAPHWKLMSAVMSQNFMWIGQLVQELSPKNLFSDLVLYQVALMALLAGIWLNLLLLVVATRSIWNFDHRISRKKVIGGCHGKDPHCTLCN